MNYSFHPAAEMELNQAVEYYESCAEGLGLDFSLEIYDTIKRIIAHPTAWAILSGLIRRCQAKRFPYGIVYSVGNNHIFILAVMHLHRRPAYWADRIQ